MPSSGDELLGQDAGVVERRVLVPSASPAPGSSSSTGVGSSPPTSPRLDRVAVAEGAVVGRRAVGLGPGAAVVRRTSCRRPVPWRPSCRRRTSRRRRSESSSPYGSLADVCSPSRRSRPGRRPAACRRSVGGVVVFSHAAILGRGRPVSTGVSPLRSRLARGRGRRHAPGSVTADAARPPDAPFLLACRNRPAEQGARVVHAPGRPVAARVPGDPGQPAASSTRCRTPTSPPRSPSSRCAATASTPPSSTATSWCRWRRSASASRSSPASGPWSPGRSATRPTSTGCAPSTPRPTAPTCSRPSATWSASWATCPLIGFAGAPFTVASYLVEGGPSRTLGTTKALMLGRPDLWAALLDRLADIAIASLRAQVQAGRVGGAAVRQLGRARSAPRMYERHVMPASAKVLAGVADLRRAHHPLRRDHRRAAAAAWPRRGRRWWGSTGGCRSTRPGPGSGPTWPCRATSTPAVCLAPWPAVEAAAREVLAANGGRPGHVFNLGHGVLPETDPDVLARLVDAGPRVGRRRGDHRPGGHGLRHPGVADRDRGLLHPHPPGPTRRPPSSSPS